MTTIQEGAATTMQEGAAYDPETVEFLRSILDDAWASLLPTQQAQTTKSAMAERILEAAAKGERDPARLRAWALGKAIGA